MGLLDAASGAAGVVTRGRDDSWKNRKTLEALVLADQASIPAKAASLQVVKIADSVLDKRRFLSEPIHDGAEIPMPPSIGRLLWTPLADRTLRSLVSNWARVCCATTPLVSNGRSSRPLPSSRATASIGHGP